MSLTRRTLIAGAAALPLLTRPARSAAAFDAVRERARALPQLWSLSIAQNGTPHFAEAFRGPALSRAVNVKSVSKTIVSALTGAAIDRGLIPDVNASIGALAPRLIPASADPRVADITVEHLVTLRAGLERTSGANYGDWVSSRNWVANALARPMLADPGTRFLYSTGSTHILGALLAEVSGRSLLALARDWIGAPLGIDIPAWTRDPQGRYLGGNEMALTPAALLAFGEAYRRDGGGIVSPDWVQASWTAHTRSPFSRHEYGYGWFLTRAGEHRVAYARGYGGQMLWVVPSLALTAVAISDPNLPARSDGHVGELQRLLADVIVPAAEIA